jgi:hypothetical protein
VLATVERPTAPPVAVEEGPFEMTDTAGDRLTRLETKFDVLIQQNTMAFAKLDTVHGDHETRLRALEARVWVASGVATGAGGLIGILTQILMSR